MKRFFIFCLVALVSVTMWAADSVTVDDVVYNILSTDDLTCEVGNQGSVSTSNKTYTIPETIDYEDQTYTVIGVGDEAFNGVSKLKSVTLPSTITYIGKKAFDTSSANFFQFTLPEGLETIGESAFENCYLEEIEIPSTVTSIGSKAFYGCGDLESVYSYNPTPPSCEANVFGSSTLNSYATLYVYDYTMDAYKAADVWKDFKYISKIQTNIFIYEDILFNVVDEDAQTCEVGKQTTKTQTLSIPETAYKDGVGYTVVGVGDNACSDIWNGLYSVSFPSTIKYIGNNAFITCDYLSNVTLPEGLESIGDNAFWSCHSFTEVNLPSTLIHLGSGAFAGDSEITSAITIPEGVTELDDWVFYNCSNVPSFEIKGNVTRIGDNAFYHCYGLTSIDWLPESLETIDHQAFNHCVNLEKIVIPENVNYIGSAAFQQCSALASANIPTNITEISDSTFFQCTQLSSLEIPSKVTKIGDYAFYGCPSIESLTIPGTVKSIGAYAFAGYGEYSTTYVNMSGGLTLEDGIQSIGNCAFQYRGIPSVTVPSSVTSLGTYVFYECEDMTEANIYASISALPNYTLSECKSLEYITIGESIRTLYAYDFTGSGYDLKGMTVLQTTPPSCGSNIFDDMDTVNGILYVPVGTRETYAKASEWSEFRYIVEISDTLTVSTISAIDITDSSVTLSGSIFEKYDDYASEVGFEYWADEDEKSTTPAEVSGNDMVANIAELTYGTTYTYRAYAINGSGISYGEELTFTTDLYAPVVETLEAGDITAVSATLNGAVETGSEPINRKGFAYWSEDPNVIITMIVTEDDFVCAIDGLTPETTYTYRAFVITDSGTTYGEDVEFTTDEDTTTGINGISLDSENVEGIYTTSGQKLNTTVKGVNIIRYNDGSVKKIYVK